ncbi:MAG: substrate-binding domain-containing protein [Ginsengibacter sp.]
MKFNLNHIILLFYILMAGMFVSACSSGHVRTDIDTVKSGTIHISVDETFKPVIDSEIQVFESLFPQAHIIPSYKPEAECLKDLIKDSTRMIIITRGLDSAEEKFYKDSIKYAPNYDKVANDAVALIVNNKSPDSVFTLSKIRGILDGSTADRQIAVLDGLSATSSVRFVVDSILRGKPFDRKKVFAAKSTTDVINYVANNPNSIGFVGVSWIGNKEDTAQLTFLQKVRIAALECRCVEKTFVKPFQYNIMTRRYPLVRGLYYVVKENYDGLGSGFSNFLQDEKGQLIFKRAYLGPSKLNFTVTPATMNSN